MRTINTSKILKGLYTNCRVSVDEARELSWRKFYHDIGGIENVPELEGTNELGRLIKKTELIFLNILENKVEESVLQEYIALAPTEIWRNTKNGKVIKIKKARARV